MRISRFIWFVSKRPLDYGRMSGHRGVEVCPPLLVTGRVYSVVLTRKFASPVRSDRSGCRATLHRPVGAVEKERET